MGDMVERGKVTKQLSLALLVVLQITMAPIILFSLTYLIHVDYEAAQVSVRTELIHWVVTAGLSYGVISIALALVFGGFRPFFVTNQGGVLPFLRLSPRTGDPELVDRARLHLQGSPYGKMVKLVHSKTKDGDFDLMAIHGGLQLLAVPMQVILIVVPLVIMEGMPDYIVRPSRAFDLGMAGYLVALWIAVRVHPLVSWHLVGIAAMFRNVVWRVSRLSWILPIFLYWLVARLVLLFSLDVLNVNYEQWHEMQLEKIVLEMIAPDAEMPETAILDFIVAISVLPMATFTTISVLGGSQSMPDWMFGQEEKLESLRTKELSEGGDISNSDVEGGIANPEEGINEANFGETLEGSEMIDMPFDLFKDD
ncbi:MAG: hypothetical protein ACJZ42_05315 [Candidatus Thalassarchaeaceae archaeon]|nr:MAG: hypothetical protein CND84_00925 [Marine Group II euryarchaeote MED-G35]